jgi:hypothetical protein
VVASFAGIACKLGVKSVDFYECSSSILPSASITQMCEVEEKMRDPNEEKNEGSNQQFKRFKSREPGVPNIEKIFQRIRINKIKYLLSSSLPIHSTFSFQYIRSSDLPTF